MSNFAFLQEWPELFESAALAEGYVRSDPRAASIYARLCLENMVRWLFANDPEFTPRPYDNKLNALLRSETFTRVVPSEVQPYADLVRLGGNAAAHGGQALEPGQAMGTVRDLWHVAWWFVWRYGAAAPEASPKGFNEALVPPALADAVQLSRQQLAELEQRLAEEQIERENLRGKLAGYEAEVRALREQVAARTKRNTGRPAALADSEKVTRERLIDLLLREAGWEPDDAGVREFPVTGMPTPSGKGFVDYVLWGADGLPLAVVEAKKTRVNAQDGRQQAKLYADRLEAQFGRRPVIFYSNGVHTYLWDDAAFVPSGGYPPHEVAGFYTRDELELMIGRRRTRLPLPDQAIKDEIVERPYQHLAVRAVTERLTQRQRRGLLVMATGTGKTRTAAAIIELLVRAGWVKRVLFLADRQALVRQTVGVLGKFLAGGVHDLLASKKDVETARVVVSTHHTVLSMIESGKLDNGEKLFGPGHFDLVIVDEAHRSIYRTFGAIFAYFDAHLLGLTATPKDEVDRNTYRLFEMEDGVPLYAYSLEEAVQGGYLVPPRGLDRTPRFLQRGIRYAELSEEEKDEYDAIEWEDFGGRREEIPSTEINNWLFNQSTVDEVLKDVVTQGIKVQGGDVLGKTIIFAANHKHALYIVERFEANFPHLHDFARVIDSHDRFAGTLIEDFANPAKQPTIAVSVDMLDTGIDVPEVVNLVLFKVVRSKTKFTQMIGRGTRLRPDLFGPGQHKTEFKVLDYGGNLAFFALNPDGKESTAAEPILQRTFKAQLGLLSVLAPRRAHDAEAQQLYTATADALHARVAGMTLHNFMVRPHRDLVEPFLERGKWDALTELDHVDLARTVSGLPSTVQTGDEGARRFDELIARLQLARLTGNNTAAGLTRRVQNIAAGLSAKANIPDVAAQADMLGDLQEGSTWASLTPVGLEYVRGKVRGLVALLDREERSAIYTDFRDEIVGSAVSGFPDFAGQVDGEQYRRKVEAGIRAQAANPVIHKLRCLFPLSAAELDALEVLLFEASAAESREVFEEVYGQGVNLADFIRSLVGLDRQAAEQVFAKYLNTQMFNAAQIRFVQNIVDMLTRKGSVPVPALFAPPFTNNNPKGLDGLFGASDADEIMTMVRAVNRGTLPLQS